ncbi:phosphoadenosine phosphosulfate reductase family protein [Priestia aryabhattai]|uniref:Phosphoadenosine phosphosulfate reductase family protein n=1 Tax=Priestia aryabhattai TaxID=412384 RepID=A0AAX6NE06_PRIAR|nr:phosphoadenosine phosphosulfate reductase family protein [Priestia aryabhattai]MDU9694092.1 phosphoadenosine phosphosulfate reductase family protein [Priestia aryabhattai]
MATEQLTLDLSYINTLDTINWDLEPAGMINNEGSEFDELYDTLRLLGELNSGEFEQKFEEIISFLEELYFKEDKEWMVTYSGGKDSTLVLVLVFRMLSRLTKEKRFKRVHIVSADTKVETYQMSTYLKKNLQLIKLFETELNLVVHLVEPDLKNLFFWNVIGRGVVAPKPPSPFQWCTKKMKINPMNEKTKEIISQAPVDLTENLLESEDVDKEQERHYDVIMMLGSRLDESSKRAKSIEKYSSEEMYFGWNPDFNNVKMCYPIKKVITTDLWAYIMAEEKLPWGLPTAELYAMYSDGTECPMTKTELASEKGCGSTNSRNGCWVCLYSGSNDKMLETLISSGQTEVKYLADWKRFLYDVTFDIRYRESLRRIEVKQNNKKLVQSRFETLDMFNFLEDDPIVYRYNQYKLGGKEEYEPGGFTIELRLILLQKLLYTQEMAGYELISNEELFAILDNWKEEGYLIPEEEIKPVNHQYDGALVFAKDGEINYKETTNSNDTFFVEVHLRYNEMDIKELIKERQRATGKSFYCFFKNQDLKNHHVAYHTLTIVVCKEEITTQTDAENHIYNWLFGKDVNHLSKPVSYKDQDRFNNSLIVNAINNVLPNIVEINEMPEVYKEFFNDLILKNTM